MEKGPEDGDRLPALINSLGGRPDPPTANTGPFALHLQSTSTPSLSYVLDNSITITTSFILRYSQWVGFLGLPATRAKPQPRTAAALHRIERVARAAGKAAICSSPAWTRTIFWTGSKRTARHERSALRRSRSLRKPVQKAGYVLGSGVCASYDHSLDTEPAWFLAVMLILSSV